MAFLTQSNYNLLYNLVTETHTQIQPDFFQNVFLEFGRKENGPLMELNKKFIRKLMNKISTQNKLPPPSQLIPQQTQSLFSFNQIDTTRPQGMRSKNVTFDEQLELHKQHFQQFSAPTPPPTPVFSDDLTQPSSGIDELMKKTLMERKYDTLNINPPPSLQQQPYHSQRPPRKLEIGSVVNDTEVIKQDMIDIDDLGNIPLKPQPTFQNKNLENLFSKLRVVPPISSSQTLEQNTQTEETEQPLERNNLIEQLTKRVEHLEIELAELKKHFFEQNKVFNLELKERPTSPSTDGPSSFINQEICNGFQK